MVPKSSTQLIPFPHCGSHARAHSKCSVKTLVSREHHQETHIVLEVNTMGFLYMFPETNSFRFGVPCFFQAEQLSAIGRPTDHTKWD